MQDDNVKVTAALVDHPPIEHAFAYRFDAPDRSIVISGDTAVSKNLIALAKGADVLVHEALWVPAVDRIVAKVPNATTLKQHIIDSHTAVEDCGRVAAAAGVKTLVLSHLVPPDDPAITDQMWIDAAKKHFSGNVIVGQGPDGNLRLHGPAFQGSKAGTGTSTWNAGLLSACFLDLPQHAILHPVRVPPFHWIHRRALQQHREVQVIAAG